MENNQPFRWAFIGAGTLAHKVASLLSHSSRNRLVAVYNRTAQKAVELASLYGAKAYSSLDEMLQDPSIDGVYINTTTNCHREQAEACLRAKKPVLMEKSMTVNAEDCAFLRELAHQENVYLAEAMWTWFSPIARAVKSWVDAGHLGKLKRADFSYCFRFSYRLPRLRDPQLCGGALLDIGVYPLTYAYRLFGYPSQILCQGELEEGIDTGERITLLYPDAEPVHIRVSMVDPRGFERMRLSGERGRINCPLFHHTNTVTFHEKGHFPHRYKGDGGYDNEFTLAGEEIRAGLKESSYVPLQATYDVLRMMDECRRQMGLFYPMEKAK